MNKKVVKESKQNIIGVLWVAIQPAETLIPIKYVTKSKVIIGFLIISKNDFLTKFINIFPLKFEFLKT